ncbi:MAG TPA: alpha/beta fold hydrolase [Vicinamibacterales bacterium]|nr:alpha/beta fold hydrolase [Vicinamibacterales bacterium]
MAHVTRPLMTFGPFTLDPVTGHLYRGGAVVPLTPKAFGVLHHLAAQPGRLFSKQELLDAVWPSVFVSDAVLKVTIREIRKALGDDAQTPRFIETAHRRGYRLIAEPRGDTAPPVPVTASVPAVRYARSGEVNIAYQVVGSGPIDLVFVMGWVSHLEYFWNEPSFARFLSRLASMSRLILFDKRGTGLSDAVAVHELPTLEQRMDDVRAVMDAAGSEQAVLLGVSEGGPMCALFAATYPEKTEALIMIGSYARRLRDLDYPWGPTRAERDAFCRRLLDEWGGPVGVEERAPSLAKDPAFRQWWASYLRMGASPGAAVALTEMNAEIDIRDVLPSVRVPALVLHRTGDRCLFVEEGRYLAARIEGAEFVELPGDDHLPFVGDQEAILSEIARFLARRRLRILPGRVLATVLTVVAPAAVREQVRQIYDREVAWYRGSPLLGADGFSAFFDGPARAVQCACAVSVASGVRGMAAGVHIGEIDPTADDGPVVRISRQLASAAAPGEVLVSRTVVDLVPGSGLRFDDRGAVHAAGSARELGVMALRL